MCERVAADVLDPDRLTGLVDIGVDEISWRKHHRYLTLVTDHATSTVMWGPPAEMRRPWQPSSRSCPLGTSSSWRRSRWTWVLHTPRRCASGRRTRRERAPDAVLCFDPFHVVQLATKALDSVRRQVWQSARRLPDQSLASTFKGSRWALLKNPGDLTDTLTSMSGEPNIPTPIVEELGRGLRPASRASIDAMIWVPCARRPEKS